MNAEFKSYGAKYVPTVLPFLPSSLRQKILWTGLCHLETRVISLVLSRWPVEEMLKPALNRIPKIPDISDTTVR
jgi:hypothetical protein